MIIIVNNSYQIVSISATFPGSVVWINKDQIQTENEKEMQYCWDLVKSAKSISSGSKQWCAGSNVKSLRKGKNKIQSSKGNKNVVLLRFGLLRK